MDRIAGRRRWQRRHLARAGHLPTVCSQARRDPLQQGEGKGDCRPDAHKDGGGEGRVLTETVTRARESVVLVSST